MTSNELLTIILIALLLVLLPAAGLYGMFKKANVPAWKALIPFYNTWVMLEIAQRPKYWFFLQFIPVVGWFITVAIYVEFVKPFGKYKFYQHALAALLPVIYFIYIGYNKKDRFVGVAVARSHKKSAVREWVDAGVFAIVAATLIRIFIFEAYTIPTASMEKTLLVNDFLFVSKLTYGPRIPNTPLAVPFVHHTIPYFNTKSYTEIVKLPYIRWFASPIKRNDVVVFNFPAGDTVINRPEYQSLVPYYDVILFKGDGNTDLGRKAVLQDDEEYPLIVRPVDKRENYIKRCVGIAGDTILIKDGVLFVNGDSAFVSPTSATDYRVITNNKVLSEDELREAGVRLNHDEESPDFYPAAGNTYRINLSAGEAAIVKGIPGVVEVKKEIDSNADPRIFPRAPLVARWSTDEFGPLWIPKKGVTIQLTPQNIAFYQRAIQVYENNTWEERNGKIFINGQETTTYTFKMDYFWMMGDNRHRSQDSRYWGFVPEDHVVGSAWMIWMSWDKGIRWNRLFRKIH